MSDEKIYIQIASYRDPELLPTIIDCIKRADNPENLVFGICWQHSPEDEWDTLDAYKDDLRFRIIDIDLSIKESLGTCWARSLLNDNYGGEKYTLQLDSHHRFVRGWDTLCKKMFNDLISSGVKKPLITAYLPSFDPKDDPYKRVREVWKLDFDRFIPEGAIFMLPSLLENFDTYELPVPTRFFSAHFVFTYGKFIEECPYDPNLYFHGEEISLAVRAYTHGYDLFTPNKIVAWHEYTRQGRVRHWDESRKWEKLNNNSLRRVKVLLDVDGDYNNTDFGKYGFGKERTKEEYENYAGIRFKDRKVQRYTKLNHPAPNPVYRTKEEQEKSWRPIYKHCIDIYKETLPIWESDYDCIVIALFDYDGIEIYRRDLSEEDIQNLEYERTHRESDPGDFYNIWIDTEIEERPYSWLVWPHSKSKDWLDRIEGKIPNL